ncbi:MAG: PKD domain-containing protein, partial [Marinoscillum sp.]
VLFDTLGGAGTYMVRLEVTDGTCSNNYEEEIIIYAEPPVPSFTVTSSGSLCTNNELTLTNTTDETGYDDVLTYQWVIDGEVASQKDTVYTFTESGEKTITLQSFLPGCSSAITEQNITIVDGPLVSFTYSNNCFEEAIVFTSEVEGTGITGYSWDFGDGTGSSTDANPTYTYLATGDYTVSLTVTNDAGCETEYSELLTVSDTPAADFSVDVTTENLPTRFYGEDLTHSGDSVETWLWNVEGAEFGEDTIEYTFTAPGDYLVSLDVTTYQGCAFTVSKTVTINAASEPTSLFSSVDEACIDEQVTFVNESANAASYEWDFCSEDILVTPLTSELESLALTNQPFEIEVVEDNGSWYGFITNRNSNTLLRLDFGADLLSDPTEVDLGDFGELLDGPSGIGLLQVGTVWYGITGNLDDGLIHLLTFGDGIDQSPTIANISVTGITTTDGVELINDNGSYKAIILSGANLHILDFGSDITSAPTQSTVSISGATRLWDISLIREGGSWYAILDAFTSGKLFHLDFGATITSTFTVTQIDMSGITFNSPTDLNLVRSGSDVYGLVNLRSGNLVRLNFGPDVEDLTPSIEVLSGLNLGNDLAGQSLVSKDGSLIVFTTDFIANSVSRLVFEDSCSVSGLFSTQEMPDPISFTEAGSYEVSLTAIHENGTKDISTKLIVVNDQMAPDASFSIDDSRCITNANTFTPSILGLTSYSWDFNGDGIEDSDAESPQVLFDTLGGAGTYMVRLEVTDGTCSNNYEEEIIIYAEPPVPGFNVSASRYCIGADIDFSNITDDASYTGPLTYAWEFVDDATSTIVGTSNEENPSFAFTTSGSKTIILTSSIPGCEDQTQQTITINPSPTANFSANSVCQNESMQFTNTSTDAISYLWDFGDGFTSTDENPSHIFTEAGNYLVDLTAANEDGCDQTTTIEVAVSDNPQVNFDFEIPCDSDNGVTFTDLSTVSNADLVSW